MNVKKKPMILIVDDNIESLLLLEFLLKDNDYDIFISDNGDLAISSALSLDPDLILLCRTISV